MATYKKFNVSKPRKEVLKTGEEKTFWDNVGVVTIFTKDDGSESGLVELHSFNEDIRLNIFPFPIKKQVTENDYSQASPKNDYSQTTSKDNYSQTEEEINIENIPF